jgi:CRISPR/Cas system-associated exonuclease Cas4 (RecB family)
MAQLHAVVSPSAVDRLVRAGDALRAAAPGSRALIVGASRGAADDFVRGVAKSVPATFGIERLSLTQTAARTALVALALDEATPSSRLGAEAVAARAAFDAVQASALGYFGPVAAMPGFPRALARTLQELRLAGIAAGTLSPLPLSGPDLAWLLDRFDACFTEAAAVDRAALFRTAARAVGAHRGYDCLILLDVPIEHVIEREFVAALAARAGRALATVPHGDADTLGHLAALGADVDAPADRGTTDLARLRRYLFATGEEPPRREALDGSVQLFSAPGEGRESVEIARRILAEAQTGVRFDEMAVVVRSPASYFGLLEHALARAEVPAWFGRGTRRPHPAGRAFLALLACAAEQLSASRFAEYLSLGQVPDAGPPLEGDWVPSADEELDLPESARLPVPDADDPEPPAPPGPRSPIPGPRSPVPDPRWIAPWRWEKLLVDAAVIGRDAARWERRLAGKAAELDRQIAEATDEHGPDSGRVEGLRKVRQQLDQLRRFALPIVEELAAWPRAAAWGAWLDAFTRLAPRVLRTPAHVLRVLADLRPMAEVGPVDLDEARRVLAERLLTLESEPPTRRFGRVFVGTPQQARGRSFRVVFVPGLAERMFPQKPQEDPLLLDGQRQAAAPSLRTQPHRLASERLFLHLAVGAAAERLYASYPRIELAEARARVPSFYALDVMRAATGRIPDFETLEEHAREAGRATLAWPAPPRPDEAIDDVEHDLAVLRRLFDERDRAAVRGHAHYLLKLNECLRRSVIDRWARGEARWSVSDGLIRVADDTRAMLASQRLSARPYSLSALQRFAACPYQFLLAAVYRLQPLEEPEPLQRMDPLTRGSLFHEMQARFLRALDAQGRLPVVEASLEGARHVLDRVIDEAAARAYDELAPAVDRVWHDAIASIRRDLHGWLPYLAHDGDEWRPRHFELAFGEVPGERDAKSLRDEVTIDGGFRLRGAVDLIEEHRTNGTLRVTDHKTGRRPERIEKVIVGGGAVLQPVLYGMAIEQALGRPVSAGRLFYCTAAGGFAEHPIPVNERTRASGLEVLQVIDRAIETGFLAAAPTEEACGRCDFRPVCGSDVFRRVGRKPQDRLADLAALRSRP